MSSDDGLTVPIVGAVIYSTPGGQRAVLQLDASERPDVADLMRVARLEPGGAWQMQWFPFRAGPHHVLAMAFRFTEPAACSFRFILDRALHLEAMRAAAAAGELLLTVEPIALTYEPQFARFMRLTFEGFGDIVEALEGESL